MRVLSNPIVLRMVLVLFACAFSFFMAVMIMRRMRRRLGEESAPQAPKSLEQLPLHMYHAVIQELKQQKHELQTQQQAEYRRARTSETLSAAILSNLSNGVLFFGANGLVRQANQAAKSILGIASPVGMNAEAIFRNAALVHDGQSSALSLAAAIQRAIREGGALKRAEASYVTPAGAPRVIAVTVSAVKGADGRPLGVACLLEDQSEIAALRQEMEARGELSAEMAWALRNSLAMISGYAEKLAGSQDLKQVREFATEIRTEVSHLDRTIGGFLARSRFAQAASNGL